MNFIKKNWMLTLAVIIMWFNVGVHIVSEFHVGAVIWTGAACLWSYLLYEKYKGERGRDVNRT